jgi:uncharacterized caspase-like protein
VTNITDQHGLSVVIRSIASERTRKNHMRSIFLLRHFGLRHFGARSALALYFILMAATNAFADKRVALVLGISNYQNVPQLANPDNDAAAMSDVFKKAGFNVVELRRDLGVSDMRRVVREFAATASDADMAVVYYAGHGIEVDGANYLIPADAKLLSDFDVEDEAVSLDRILQAINPAKRLRLVILDACRDNPFSKKMKRDVGTRSVGRGLAKIEPATANTLIAFAAKAGAVAGDGDGAHSPFATALIKHIATPGLDLRLAFGRVRDEVLKSTGSRQEPFVYGSLGGDTVALVPQIVPPVDPNAEARRDYEFAAQIGTKEAWGSFLAAHSGGIYANLARAALDKLEAAEKASERADVIKRQAEEQAKQKTEDFKRQIEEQAARQTEQAKEQMSEQAKRDLEQQRQRIAEQAKRELDEAKRQLVEARKQAEDAATQVEHAKKQAVAEAQQQVEAAKREAESQAKRAAEQDAKDRRDYELAAQIGTKAAWGSFLAAHSGGIYANLAHAILDQLEAAEKASEKADVIRRQAEEQAKQKAEDFKRQLEEQAARQTEQAKEQMSEQAKRDLEQERRRITEQAKREVDEAKRQVAEAREQADDAAARVEQAKKQAVAEAQQQVDAAKREAEGQAKRAAEQEAKVAALTTPADQSSPHAAPITVPMMDPADIARLLQAHLKRVGCDPGAADGNWNDGSQKALDGFNRNAGTKFDVKVASLDALDAVRTKTERVCPLVCGKGQKVAGDRCVQITCEINFTLDSGGTCRKQPDVSEKRKTVSRQEPSRHAPVGPTGGGGGKCFSFSGKRYCE